MEHIQAREQKENCPLYGYRNGHRPKEGECIKESDLDKKIGG